MQLFIHEFSQTLTTLALVGNQIGAQGAEHLANALQKNKVTLFTPLNFLCNCAFINFPQTLRTLKLYNNKIGAQGAEHLANALQQNKVTLLTLFHFL
jgi:Ran GTPase-activating protein (RanGAP) involved in mRNA processing and transport